MGEALGELLRLLDLEQLEVNLFRGVSPDESQQRVFGGQVAGQALIAAGRTVESDRFVHSLHAYFLRPGDPSVPIVYEVDRIRDGRSFTTRRVVAIQHGRAIFNLAASFQCIELGVEHFEPMPDVAAPEDLPSWLEMVRRHLPADAVGEWATRERPIDSRYTAPPPWLDPTPREPAQDVWIRANGELPDDPLLHTCVVTYASDITLLDTTLFPHSVIGEAEEQYQVASLDHAMWFHRPFRADDWLLYHHTSPNASGARGLAEGQIYRPDGRLVVTVIQEGLVRPVGRAAIAHAKETQQ